MLPSRPKAVLISLLASYLLSALLLFILTFVLYRLKLKESQITPVGLCPLCHLLPRRRPALRQGAAYPAIFLGAAHRNALFSGPPCRICSAAPRSDAGAFQDAPGSGLLRGRRHDRRNFKLTRKRMCLGTFSRRGAVASATIYLCAECASLRSAFLFHRTQFPMKQKEDAANPDPLRVGTSLLHPLLFRCFIRAPLFFPVLHPLFLPDGGSA